nr:aminotransferase class IV [uncultured Peptoniphilus sp.]
MLEGIARDVVIELVIEELGIECLKKAIARTELYNADEVFFSGTAMEVAPVVEVDDIKVADGKPGELTMKLKELFRDLTHGKKEKYKDSLRPVYVK